VSQAKSIANQALQTSIGYSSKSSVTSAAITNNGVPVSPSDLRGVGTVNGGTLIGTATMSTSRSTPIIYSTDLTSLGITSTDVIHLSNGKTIDFAGTSGGSHDGTGNWSLDLSLDDVGSVLNALVNNDSNLWLLNGSGAITVSGSNSALNLSEVGTPLEKLGLTSGTYTVPSTFNPTTVPTTVTTTGSTQLSALSSAITAADTLTVNGQTINFTTSGSNSYSATGATINISSGSTVQNILTAIDTISGTSTASMISLGAITLNAGSGGSLSLTGSALSKLGLSATVGNSATANATGSGPGNTLTFGAIGNGTATTVTFGDGTGGTVKTLDQLNAALSTNNLQATLSTSGQLTITTTNDNASASIGTFGGSAFSSASGAFHGTTASAPVADAASQATRTALVNQYNAILTQIDSTASDASFNGINLLNGDQLQLTFNETGKSKLSFTGVNDTSAGLGLSSLSSSAFRDNSATNAILASLNTVSTNLRSQASAFGSNLSVVQTRQDFNKNLINVLQTGSANLTQADINLEAANSQALSTRQSLSISALSLANQSQQSVLQLLR
jgi:flagellin-like hook-associated protein FlgL